MRDPTRQVERLMAIRLRYTINTYLEHQGIATPAAIGAAAGPARGRNGGPAGPPAGALRRRGGAAGRGRRLGLEVALPDIGGLRGKAEA